jgi:hypothetical protein
MVDERQVALELAIKHFSTATHYPYATTASIVAMAATFERYLRYGAEKKSDSAAEIHVANPTVTA